MRYEKKEERKGRKYSQNMHGREKRGEKGRSRKARGWMKEEVSEE